MTTKPERKEPISMRLPESDLAMIDRAAKLRGRSRTDFMRDAAVRAAEEAVLDSVMVGMSAAAFTDFVAAVSAPGQPVPELVDVLKRPAPWETQSKPTSEE